MWVPIQVDMRVWHIPHVGAHSGKHACVAHPQMAMLHTIHIQTNEDGSHWN